MKTIYTLIISILHVFSLYAQVNGYAKIDHINGTDLEVAVSNELFGQFAKDSFVIIFQMQDNVIGSNTSNNSNFGNLAAMRSTGIYEIARIINVIRNAGNVTQITIGSPLTNTFRFNSNSSVQILTYPILGGNGFTTTKNIVALPWDGEMGGIIAFEVKGTLTLKHNILADNAGFRGGKINGGSAGSCLSTQFRNVEDPNYANKGEGIYKSVNAAHAAGRGKIINGGGGGNSHNGGGGGGSHYTGGGEGGKGYQCSASSGGLGGLSLNNYLTFNRLLLGGGGGAGEANNGFNSAGGNGGGIIIIKATTIQTTGSGSSLKISANGQTSDQVGNDGAGGGGAAGSILLHVNSWSIASTRTLNITANGGTGGSVSDGDIHGGGAGGGQGVIYLSSSAIPPNTTITTLNGLGGRNSSTGTYAGDGTGIDNSGIFTSTFSILPLQLIHFKGIKTNNIIALDWNTETEINVNRYEIQRSSNGIDFQLIGTKQVGIYLSINQYQYIDHKPLTRNAYYRLKIIDNNGNFSYSRIILLEDHSLIGFGISTYPNPAISSSALLIETEIAGAAIIRIFNSHGSMVSVQQVLIKKGGNKIPLTGLNNRTQGVYNIQVSSNGMQQNTQLVITR